VPGPPRNREERPSTSFSRVLGEVGVSVEKGLGEVFSSSSRLQEDQEDRRKERDEARAKREEKESLAEERRFRHETNQSLMQIALVKALTGFFVSLLGWY